jgi:lipoprotein-releasing system ATP-binding protein
MNNISSLPEPRVLLEARGLHKTYVGKNGPDLHLLRGIDLTVHAGKSVSIRGESGSGKTTLLNVLAGLDSIQQGELFWMRKNFHQLSHTEQARQRGKTMGFVFLFYYLLPELSALENVVMAKRVLGNPVTKNDFARAEELLHRVALSERTKHMPAELSGGERQRVAIARAIMNAPETVFADEPTGSLDEKTGAYIMELLLELCAANHVGLILVTHNKRFASLTERQLVLREGMLYKAGLEG